MVVSAITTWVVVRTLIPPIAQAAPQAIATATPTPASADVATALVVATDSAATSLPAATSVQLPAPATPVNANSKGKVDVRISSSSLQIAIAIGIIHSEAGAYYNIGSAYYFMRDSKTSIPYFKKRQYKFIPTFTDINTVIL